ncbi:hypothetical protein [Acuticoccus kandeliae]|uniref:hypothetical protein n=1 Tax=Acuticoccus kandeliae TaxID=2073160 RepID=UPI0014742C7F|nr:hypothetical protein [Acuticoccus kandeliae]
MGMALAAIANDGDGLAFDEIYIGIAIVVDAHCGSLESSEMWERVPPVAPLINGLRRVCEWSFRYRTRLMAIVARNLLCAARLDAA